MLSKEELQQRLCAIFGSDEFPLVREVKIESMPLDELKTIMQERNLQVEGSRQQLEDTLRLALGGSDEVVLIDIVKIKSLNVPQLEEALSKISSRITPEEELPVAQEELPVAQEELPVAQEELPVAQEELPVAQEELTVAQEELPVAQEELTVAQEELPVAQEERAVTKKTVRKTQQELAENCGFGEHIIWDLLSSKDADRMKDKIKHLIPDQEKGQTSIEKLREVLFNNIWAQRKYTNRCSVTYIFYVAVTKDTDFNTAPDSVEFSIHPVFRCKKCDNKYGDRNCCMIYIDETGRVYQNWKSYVEENVLPGGTMIAPRNGVYNFNKNHEVILDIYCTPSGTTGAKVMNVAQTSTAVMGIGAACVPLAALAMPVAAPIMAAAGLIGLGVGAFSAITSTLNLTDRKKHEQSISLADSQARANYLGLAGGVVGVAAAGATRVMTSMAAAGRATMIGKDVKNLKKPNPDNIVFEGVELLVNGINISSIVLSGSGVANGVLDLILKHNDGEEISSLNVLQLSSSLVLFTHSVYNFRLASQIANEARTSSIRNYRETLSNRQRKSFDKLSKETVRIQGDTQGKMSIIRNINDIPDRQYLNDLFKINKQLNQKNVRPAFGAPEKGIVLNNELPVDTGALRQSVQHQQGPNILEQVTQPIPTTYNSDLPQTSTATPQVARLLFSNGGMQRNFDNLQDPFNENNRMPASTNLMSILRNLALQLPNGVLIIIKQFGDSFMRNIADGHTFQDVILSMADHFPEKTLKFLIDLAQEFIEKKLSDIHRILGLFIPTESVLFRIVKQVLDNYRNFCYEFISTKGNEILKGVRQYYMSLNPNNPNNLLKECPNCNGRYYICDL